MSYKAPIGDKDILERRSIPNPKYDGVQAVVDSGMTSGLVGYIREREVKLKKQPGELFKRVRAKAIADYITAHQAPEVLEDGGFAIPMDEYRGSPPPASSEEYLVLDCRDLEDYNVCHINGALHFPKLKLNHATNPFLPEMHAFKNKPGKMIVLYDLEEEHVTTAANTVFQKGIDNVGIIAGGLREFVQDYSALVTGVPPVPVVPRDERMQRRAEEATQARSEARTVMSHKPKSLSSSLAKPRRPSRFS